MYSTISLSRTTSLCLRIRLRLLTAGLVLLRAAGDTAEKEAIAAAAAREGRSSNNGAIGSGRTGNAFETRRDRDVGTAEQQVVVSIRSRLELLRGACATLAELDSVEEAMRASHKKRAKANSSGGMGIREQSPFGHHAGRLRGVQGKRVLGDHGHGVTIEGDRDRALRANLAAVCVSIMHEMIVTKGHLGGEHESGPAADIISRPLDSMCQDIERIIREEKVRPQKQDKAHDPTQWDSLYLAGLAILIFRWQCYSQHTEDLGC